MNRISRVFRPLICCLLPILAACAPSPELPQTMTPTDSPATQSSIRVATYNAALNDNVAGGLIARLEAGDENARRIAAVIQRQRPDLLLINEFDHDAGQRAADLFQRRYLEVGQFGEQAIAYPFRYLAPVNTGVASGFDLDRDGRSDGPGDAWGFGTHPGQYGMLVLSRFPIDAAAVRTFQQFTWKDLPDALAPVDPDTGEPWYPDAVWSLMPLSSKSHWDVPVDTPLGRLHFLVSHPTPPVFDGPEDRNGRRNHDEIRFWAEYVDDPDAAWLIDDAGRRGGWDAMRGLSSQATSMPTRSMATASIPPCCKCWSTPAYSATPPRAATALHWPPSATAVRISGTRAATITTPAISARAWAICGSTMCCPRSACRCSTAACSGLHPDNPAPTGSTPATIAWSGWI